MKIPDIAFIGGGNMARSLIGGLLANGCPPDTLRVADPDPAQRQLLSDQLGVQVSADGRETASQAQIVILAVKPQIVKQVAVTLAPVVQETRPLVISIAAGVRSTDIDRWLGGDVAIVRTMPNTPALVRSGATALYANPAVSGERRQLAESVLRAVGLTVWVEEEGLLNSVTALSGSGPAYFFLIMEVLENAGVSLGLSQRQARLLTLETAFGAAKMALESDESAAMLRARVTSPGGTTERAIAVLQEGGLEALFSTALAAAKQRADELGDWLGD
ncbi:MAG: pyrroline-5-carboxylate reductase [Gammaproteobacteria bacterium]|nr:pyrroline-5-carboxylate reductase [Gammaproteobacteria bacterium]MCP5458043.1 pyrroline-5-carboxylate reductase [Gammaproteobacteria bacterium]